MKSAKIENRSFAHLPLILRSSYTQAVLEVKFLQMSGLHYLTTNP